MWPCLLLEFPADQLELDPCVAEFGHRRRILCVSRKRKSADFSEAENPLQTANVEGFEVFNVATVQDPGFISTEQYIVTQTAL